MSLPAADELFRTTGGAAVQPSTPTTSQDNGAAEPQPAPPAEQSGEPAASGAAGAAGTPDEGAREGRAARGRSAREPRGKSAREREGREREGREPQVPSQPKRDGTGRPTVPPAGQAAGPARGGAAATPQRKGRGVGRRPSGRERHDEKITVYVSAEELMDLEHARLVLRGEHGLAVDRGRIVREAVAVVLADLESRGDASILVRRLRGR
ncbi:hypothetical protein FH609_030370 [Streptomyces sp. 3MP-14]|uniref:Cobyrinic acid a,c-diamide synthase n=1 Tax=Streptomyces mimosae TaxID=2586635 RepID=A0A5N5ZPU6_9ACTN|nr:hypothetical protein FH607_029905 [Streptomyces mimosae]KAB8172333.1 hypothetical protein FH609_030370 [Streptomyces sp. 3MP-14]